MGNTAVAIFAYKRPVHLLRVLRALTPQVRSRQLPVHIFLDGSKSDVDSRDIEACFRIASMYQEKCGFVVRKNACNQGLYKSLTSGVTEMFMQFQRLIVLEDDILTSPYFIDYMLNGLDAYEANPRVASIHGYSLPFNTEVDETFFLRGADCWGWATWRDRWSLFRSDASNMVREIEDHNLGNDFDLGGQVSNLRLLKNRAENKSNSWAICWHASCFLADKLTLHPGRSLVKNIGLDSSGEHCSQSLQHDVSVTCHPIRIREIEVAESVHMSKLYGRLQAPLPLSTRVNQIVLRKSRRFRHKVRRLARSIFPSKLLLSGNYSTFESAISASSPYDGEAILSQVTKAAESVLRGDSAYERDGKTFEMRPTDLKIYERLDALMKPDSTIADFGGGVGGLFFNAPEIFPVNCRKIVIEQASMVKAGRHLQNICDTAIEYFDSGDLFVLPELDILVLSAVLQYISNPVRVLLEVVDACKPKTILIDRTAVSKTKRMWHIQHNPGYYSGEVSYPIRPLNAKEILRSLPDYKLVKTWKNDFDPDLPEHVGLELQHKDAF